MTAALDIPEAAFAAAAAVLGALMWIAGNRPAKR